MELLNIFIINLLVVFVVDLSGFIPELESIISKRFHFKARIPKPFSCSLCMTFWLGLIYTICTSSFSLPTLLFISALSLFSKNTAGFIRWIQETLITIENFLYKLIR